MKLSRRPVTTALVIVLLLAGTYFSLGLAQSTPAPAVVTVDPNVTIGILQKPDANGQRRTSDPQVSIDVIVEPPTSGTIIAYVNHKKQLEQTIGKVRTGKIAFDLSEEKDNVVYVTFTPSSSSGQPIRSTNSITVYRDTTGPNLISVHLTDLPNSGSTLVIRFDDDDLKSPADKNMFVIHRQAVDGSFPGDKIDYQPRPIVEGHTVQLFLGKLPAGLYQLTVKDSFTDQLGNPKTARNPADQKERFVVTGSEERHGKQVEFPQFTPPGESSLARKVFNPSAFVTTRVARLYYYRDAQRVAQIINRNVRSLNSTAVTQAQIRAEKSRDDADELTDERRKSERAAAAAAQAARLAESQLESANAVMQEVRGIDRQITQLTTESEQIRSRNGITTDEVETLGSTIQATIELLEDVKNKERNKRAADDALRAAKRDPNQNAITIKENELDTASTNLQEAEGSAIGKQKKLSALNQIKNLQNNIALLQGDIKQLTGTIDATNLQTTITNTENAIANLRAEELRVREKAENAQAKEDRARAKQFRDEVAAQTTDPNTYVAGKITSPDPVTQVSISVIGEGEIHLRGPIKGINTIRRMINQIDAPVGQVKIGVFTVQVNGEEGDKMEKVASDIEGNVDLARFLVNQSLNLLRRSIQSEAAMVAAACGTEAGHYQVDRDRRYLYAFFGRDFIDELYAMDSEFLHTENKLLSLHSMDTVSLNRALFILALAKNDIRERIVARFLESAKTDLADAEYDFRRSSELKPHRTQKHFPPWNLTHLPVWNKPKIEETVYEAVHRNAMQRYHFRNVRSIFDTGFGNPDTMNPMQREFIRLAQIFKARLVAEMELNQRVLERGLIEDRSNDDEQLSAVLMSVREEALKDLKGAYLDRLASGRDLRSMNEIIASVNKTIKEIKTRDDRGQLANRLLAAKDDGNKLLELIIEIERILADTQEAPWITQEEQKMLQGHLANLRGINKAEDFKDDEDNGIRVEKAWNKGVVALGKKYRQPYLDLKDRIHEFSHKIGTRKIEHSVAECAYQSVMDTINNLGDTPAREEIEKSVNKAYNSWLNANDADNNIAQIDKFLKKTRSPLDHHKLLNHLIDEQEDKFIELVEGSRSHIAVFDQYLKRLTIALEDDFKVQFYDPAFVRIRSAARARSVNLGQVERTTILTNNRVFAKVDPQATMEFDLPKRQLAIKEAFDAARALVEDTGALMNDPTFLAAFQMMGGGVQPSVVKNMIPGQSSSTDQQNLGFVPPPQASGTPGSALQSLVPEPAIYKIETGTGFQIRPVIQPDGDSVVYDFDYMYTTNIREPVRADEKHIGRIKRHFVHTAVQTSSFELREISRYQVALKVSRTSRGVPLLEDIPVLGAAFQPAPSAESSLQQNIIFGQTTVYPTLFDLMGLRWAKYIVDLDHISLLESEHIVRGRNESVRNFVFDEAQKRVDDFFNIKNKYPEHYRPDLYHRHRRASPYHPDGYTVDPKRRIPDPTGRAYERSDRRPSEMQDPAYELYRHRPVRREDIGPGKLPESIPAQETPPLIDLQGMRTRPGVQSVRFDQTIGSIRPHGPGNSSPARSDRRSNRLRRLTPLVNSPGVRRLPPID